MSATLPCDPRAGEGLTYAGSTPTGVLVWCPAPDDRVQLYRSTDLATYEALGPPLDHGHQYPTTYPQLVGPYPVDGGSEGVLALVRIRVEFAMLEPGGALTPVTPRRALMQYTDLFDDRIFAHGQGVTYVLGADGSVQVTTDAGRTWTQLRAR